MKINDQFVLREISGSFIVVPTGDRLVDLNGMITLNETGAFLWNLLLADTTKETLADAMTKEFDIDGETAEADIQEFIESLKSIGALSE